MHETGQRQLLARDRPSGPGRRLEDQHTPARASQGDRGRQPVWAGADDERVIAHAASIGRRADRLDSREPLADNAGVRHHGSITSLSWIPSEAVEGSSRLAFEAGIAHYDMPPPEVIEDLEALRAGDRFRFANVLEAWVEVDDAGRHHRLADAGAEA